MKRTLSMLLLFAASAVAVAGEEPEPAKVLAFARTQVLLDLCTSGRRAEMGQCEGFITGVAAMMQNDQLSKVKACIPKGTNSQQVTDKVVDYLRTKADLNDMQVPAVTVVAPLLAILYNCTPGKMPDFGR